MTEGSIMKIQLGIICHEPVNNPLLERCLQSLTRVPAGIEYELLLQLTSGSHAENWNRLVDRCDADFICIMEDDTAALKPFWLKSMIETMLCYKDAGIVMPIETKDGSAPDPGFKRWLDVTLPVASTFAFCNVIRRDVGLRADENLKWFVDIDLAKQAQHLGWQCYVNGHVWLLHGSPEGRLNSPDRENLQELQRPCWEYFTNKWNGKENVT